MSNDERLKEKEVTHNELGAKLRGISSQYVFFKDNKENNKRLVSCKPNILHAMMEFPEIKKNISFFNRIMTSEMKFVLKDRWGTDLDFNTATLVDSNRGFHREVELGYTNRASL